MIPLLAPHRIPALVLLVAAPLAAWGERGHRLTAARALTALPPELRAWYTGREARLSDAAVEPDAWRAHDRKEGPRHYLNTEFYGGPADIPREAEAALAKVGGATFQKAGTVPWVIQDRHRELVAAFRSGDAAKVAEVSGWLSHYVADLHVPLHTTTNHDGQLSDQRGVHGRWESGLVERYVGEASIQPGSATPVDIAQAPWAWLAESFARVPKLLGDDLEAARGETRDQPVRSVGYWRNYWALQGAVVEDQLTRAARHMAGLWLSAWIEAGRPKAG